MCQKSGKQLADVDPDERLRDEEPSHTVRRFLELCDWIGVSPTALVLLHAGRVLAGNPLKNRTFTDEQANYLTNRTLDLTDSDFDAVLDCGGLSERQIRPGLAVCISATAAAALTPTPTSSPPTTPTLPPTPTPSASESNTYATPDVDGSSHAGLIVGLACGGAVLVLALVVALLWCRQRQCDGKEITLATANVALLAATSRPRRAVPGSLWRDKELCFLRVNDGDIRDIREIGGGSHGVLWLVKYQHSELLASKRLVYSSGEDREEDAVRLRDFVSEIKLAATLDHPNIVRFVGVA